MEDILEALFSELNEIISQENLRRFNDGAKSLPRSRILLLGQMSLLVDKKVSVQLALAQTGDLDAKLEMDHFVKEHLKKLLEAKGFIYDEDSDLIFIPDGSKFLEFLHFENINVQRLDPESVLVSKALKAPKKNRLLLVEAIASGLFQNLIERIEKGGGDLEFILGGKKDEEK